MNIERRVYESAIKGDVRALRELIKEDELILDRVALNCFNETPLHIAAMRGHVEFAVELLRHSPQLASELDSRKSSPLHVAAVKGNLGMVKQLISADPEMCLARDRDGRNPLHLAAMKGQVEVVKELLRIQPPPPPPAAAVAAVTAVRQRKGSGGETVLHLCVKHNQVEALKVLMESSVVEREMMNARDDDGNTILHLAVSDKQIETIKYLVSKHQLAVNSTNANGYTPLDILSQGLQKNIQDFDIGEILRQAGASRTNNNNNNNNHGHRKSAGDWLSRKRDSIMVVASLIATMAFQAGVNPPGGVWQDDHSPPGSPTPHKAGEAVMAYNHTKAYRYFVRTNTTAFVASLSTILLLISGLPFRRRIFMWGLMVIMWLTVTTVALSYGISIVIVTPKQYREELSNVIQISVTVWCSVMGLMLVGNTARLIFRWMKKTGKVVSWPPQIMMMKPSTTTTTSVFTNV